MDYKNTCLQHLEEWLHDALQEASPHEIYSTIRKIVQESHDYHKENAQKCFGLLELLSGHRPVNFDDKKAWDEWEETHYPEEVKDKVKKWVLPVEEVQCAETGKYECFVSFPDDLLDAAGFKEGDQVDWIDQGDGSYLLKKVSD